MMQNSSSHSSRLRRRLPAVAVVVAASALLLSACSADGVSAGSSDAAAPNGGDVVIGYSTYTVANPAFAGILQGQEDEAAAKGFDFISANSNLDPNQQITDVQNLLTQGATYIVITPADGTAIAPAVKAAEAQGVPVIALADTIADPVTATFSMSHEEGGKLAGEEIVKFLTAKYGEPKGNVVDIQGLAGTLAATGREKGFADVMAKYPDITVVARQDGGWDTDKSNQVMTGILQANPQIDAVYGANDAEAYGATTAIKAANRFAPVGDPDHIYVIGVDGAKPAIDGIRDGSQDATVSQNFVKMGQMMVDQIADFESGKTDKIEGIEWPLQVITTQNIDSDEVAEYGIWADEVK
ncbi:sugar ABC transporter substrate-binding protein [Herbiconiux sp. P17]|uniref:sugar ABC transporter substrate-binding protein n=1 Tax=Herbiconiux wuyangfengii TaxID=3342794 RepID=UPI0035BB7907